MSIDIGRLATDRAYWDSVAPEGATHVSENRRFMKWVNGKEFSYYFLGSDEWSRDKGGWSLDQYIESGDKCWKLFEKPEAQKTQEWDGTGLPPVGTECEANDVDHGWISATVIAHDEDEGVAVCKTVYGYDGYGELRPIRTPEQREQESLALSIQNAFEGITRIRFHDEKALAIAGILMDQGYRKADDK